MLQVTMRRLTRKRVEGWLLFVIQGVRQELSILFIGVPTGRSGHGVDIVSEGEPLLARIGDRVISEKNFLARFVCRRSRWIIAS